MPQFEDISLRKAYVSGEPELVTITPKSGENKDQEVDVVKFNIAQSICHSEKPLRLSSRFSTVTMPSCLMPTLL